jgi:hypothetical protein
MHNEIIEMNIENSIGNLVVALIHPKHLSKYLIYQINQEETVA